MCGIVGAYRAGGELERIIDAMLCRLQHRGPDGEGRWIGNGMGLGHRRLAIIDLGSTGDQPMVSADGRFVAVLNGEIYNYRELRAELLAEGARFRGESDTEVMLELFARNGAASFNRLRGMFAAACWDVEQSRLTLVRDHLGKKPLYYAVRGGSGIEFASELTAMDEPVAREVDHDVLGEYLHFGYVPEPRTIYRDVLALPPGSFAVWEPGADLRIRRYWSLLDLEFGPETHVGIDELDERLKRAVALRMHSDVPLGSFLSGGVDSALIASYLTELRPGAPTITVGFDLPAWDESPQARKTAGLLETNHIVETVNVAGAEMLLDRYIDCYDQPFADSSGIPTLVLAEAARRHVTVALGGDGADEVFGGYDRYGWLCRARRWHRLPGILRNSVASTLGKMGGARAERVAGLLRQKQSDDIYLELMKVWHATDPSDALLDASAAPAFYGLEDLPDHIARSPQVIDLLNYLPHDILVKVDRATMRHGLESRSPFLDIDLVTWAAEKGLLAPNSPSGKRILKQLLERRLPSYDASLPKRGFMLPLHDWLAGPLRQRLQAAASPERLRSQGVFKQAVVADVLRRFISGDRALAFPLWAFLAFQEWDARRAGGGGDG